MLHTSLFNAVSGLTSYFNLTIYFFLQQILTLVFFLYLFPFSILSFTLIPLPTTSRMSQCYTDIHSENPTKIQTPKMKSSRASLWVHVPLSRQRVHDHTAAVRLMDLWHRTAQCRTQNPSQGADACFLLTYAPEIEQGEGGMKWRVRLKIIGRGRRRESINLEEQ